MLNSRAMAAVDSDRRLHTERSSMAGWARSPGMCRSRVLAPAPINPIRNGFIAGALRGKLQLIMPGSATCAIRAGLGPGRIGLTGISRTTHDGNRRLRGNSQGGAQAGKTGNRSWLRKAGFLRTRILAYPRQG